MTGEPQPRPFAGWPLAALITGLLGAAAALLGAVTDPRQAAFSWLMALALAIGIALGSLAMILIGHLVHATWFVVVRRLAETVAATLPLLAVLFVPLLFVPDLLYPWARPAGELGEHVAELVAKKRAYLNVPFFVVRSAVYFACWILLAEALRNWSVRQDRLGRSLRRRQLALSAPGAIVFGFTLTFAAIDWGMSLRPEWYSTIYGAYYFSGGFLAALALLVVLTWASDRAGLLGGLVTSHHYHALGRLLLTFVAFWAYMAFSQFLIIWIGNKPEEIPWYLPRTSGWWAAVAVTLVVGHFALPLLALLPRAVKERRGWLAAIAGWILAMHVVDVYWLIVPELHAALRVSWQDAASLLAVAGLAAWFGAWRAGAAPLVAVGDPEIDLASRYGVAA